MKNEEALKQFEEAKQLYLVVEDRHGLAHCIRSMGEIEQHRGKNEEALKQFEEAKQLYLALEDVGGQLNCLYSTASVFIQDSQVMKGIEFYEQAIILQTLKTVMVCWIELDMQKK
ncbi:hypothetical protein BT69DRAFT_1319754 [Atractiella rhizophila]|nr:hypothetical protein BT69DRAFT_1319754 [Atractiella rhizophila]